MFFFQPATSYKSLGHQAYEQIRDAIITLKLEPGQMIMEVELAQQLNISRTPIREALQLLINEQLLQVLPQRTKKISLISERKVRESSFVRYSLESNAFQLVADLWDSSQPRFVQAAQELKHILVQQHAAAKKQDVHLFLTLDEQFHQYVLTLAGNQTLLEVVYHMRGHLNRFRYLAMKEFKLSEQLVTEHEELFHALTSNASALGKTLQLHLNKQEQEMAQLKSNFPYYFED